LTAGQKAWTEGLPKSEVRAKALAVLESACARASQEGVMMRVDYVEVNDSETFDVVENERSKDSIASSVPILSGALWVGKTRLIDNLILGDASKITY
jgi:pantoate--beta-alanine ligase